MWSTPVVRAAGEHVACSACSLPTLPKLCLPSHRGALAVQVDLTTAKVDVHSGMAGGAVQNPARALAQLLATMWHPNNSVAIAGWYDNVRPITDADRWGLVVSMGVRRCCRWAET